jgi:serine protease DegS
VIGRDPDTDLALLKIDLPNLPAIRLGRSDTLRVGDVVLAIGNPIGLAQTVTQGIVSATGRDQLGIATFENFIQTDAPINPGNSGGALINTRGELIGVNTAIIAKSLGVEGIGFAIPVNLVRGVVDEIATRGKVIRGWIGIGTVTIDAERARQAGFDAPVVVINRIASGGPAQQAGLRPDDIILKIDGKVPVNSRDVMLRIADTSPGQAIALEVQRGDQRGEARVQVIEAPQQVRPR